MVIANWIRLLRKSAVAAQPQAGVADAAPDEEERLLGCGWFDSSHALQSGLLVTEHATADAVAPDMPLSDWLALHLAGWPFPVAAEPCLA